MITNAIGGARRSSTVAANTNRTIGRLKIRMSRMFWPNRASTTTSPTVRSAPSGTRMSSARPGSVSRSQVRAIAVMPPQTRDRDPARPAQGASEHVRERTQTCVSERAQRATRRWAAWARSLVDAAHDWIEGGHDRHRVSEQVARQERTDGLEMDEARVVDLQPERLVGAVADRVGAVHAAGSLDRRPGTTRARPQQSRQLGHDRAVGHLLEALVDDPEALLDLFHPDEVAGERVTLRPGRDIELDLRVDRVRVGATDVEWDARGAQVRPGHAEAQRGLAVDHAQAAGAADKDLVLVEEAHAC